MTNEILACRINDEDIYFVRRPQDPDFDGFIRRESGDIPIDFWAYISRFPDIEIVDKTDFLKEMWYGDTTTEEWAAEYYLHGSRKPVK